MEIEDNEETENKNKAKKDSESKEEDKNGEMFKEVEYSQVDEKLSDINTYIENTKKRKLKVEKLNIPR